MGKPSSITFNVGAPTFWGIEMNCVHGKTSAAPPGLGVCCFADPVLTHWANLSRTSGASGGMQGCRGAVAPGQGKALKQFYFADLDRGLCICVVWDVARDFGCVGFE